MVQVLPAMDRLPSFGQSFGQGLGQGMQQGLQYMMQDMLQSKTQERKGRQLLEALGPDTLKAYGMGPKEIEAAELIAKLQNAVAFTKKRENVPMIEEFKTLVLDGISWARRNKP